MWEWLCGALLEMSYGEVDFSLNGLGLQRVGTRCPFSFYLKIFFP